MDVGVALCVDVAAFEWVVELDRVAVAGVELVDAAGELVELEVVLDGIVEVAESVAAVEALLVGAVVGTTTGADFEVDVEVTGAGEVVRVVRVVVEDAVVDDVLDALEVEQLGNEVVPMRLPSAYTYSWVAPGEIATGLVQYDPSKTVVRFGVTAPELATNV